MNKEKKFVLYTEESLSTTTTMSLSMSSPTTTTFDLSRRYSEFSGLSAMSSDSVHTTSAAPAPPQPARPLRPSSHKTHGGAFEIQTNGAIVGHTSPYYYEKHMLQDQYDDHGLRQGTWEIGLCHCMAWLPMTLGVCVALPGLAVAQIATRLGLRSYRAALLKELLRAVLLIGLPVAGYFLLVQLQTYPEPTKEDTKTGEKGVAQTLEGTVVMLAMWLAFVSWIVVLLVAALAVSDLRRKIRARCQIPASRLGDFGDVVCLPTCAIAQMSTHVRCLRPGRYTLRRPETLPPYQY